MPFIKYFINQCFFKRKTYYWGHKILYGFTFKCSQELNCIITKFWLKNCNCVPSLRNHSLFLFFIWFRRFLKICELKMHKSYLSNHLRFNGKLLVQQWEVVLQFTMICYQNTFTLKNINIINPIIESSKVFFSEA